MIEKTILTYLNSNLNVEAYAEMPEKPSDPFVIVQKVGSSKSDTISRSTIAIQSYGKTLFDSAKLNEDIKEWMEKIVILPDVGGCRLNSDYNFTDPTTKRYRYQAIFNITHY